MKHALILLIVLVFAFSAHAQKPAQQVPGFFGTTLDGKTITSADLNGKVVVLNLWFINCPNCVEEIKLLNALVDEYKDNKDVVFLAPATSSAKELVPFLKKHPFKYQVIPSAMNIILGRFGTVDKKGQITSPFPMHFVVDRTGTITLRMEGIKGVAAVRAELKKQFPGSGAAAAPAKKSER
jgi:peroxiredoxin